MEPGLTCTHSSEAIIGPVTILKNGKASTLMKIESWKLLYQIFFNAALAKFTERRKKLHVPVGTAVELEFVIAEYFQNGPTRTELA